MESRRGAGTDDCYIPADTVQHCSPCSPNPDMPSDVYFRLESSKDKMGPELKELESPSAGTGLETPGQQCPPNEGTWNQGRTTASGILTAGEGSSEKGNISSPTERATSTKTTADISLTAATPSKRRHKTSSKKNKQLDRVEKERRPALERGCNSPFFFWGELERSLLVIRLCSVCTLFVLCFLNYCFFQVMTSQRAERHEGRRESSR